MIYADKAFINGRIYTMKEENQVAEAIVIYDGKIVFVGSNEEAKAYQAKETIDLKGKTILPGFTDSHMHLIMDCHSKERIDLSKCTNVAEVVDIMKKNNDGGDGWFVGTNVYIDKMAEGRFPLCHELDEISKERPVLIISYCRHAAIANSKALEVVGIDRNTKTDIPGLIDLDENGEPNGITRESTFGQYFAAHVEDDVLDPQFRKDILKRHLKEYCANGLTTLHIFTTVSGDPLEYFDQYMDLDEEGELPVRIILNPKADMPQDLRMKTGFGNNKLKIGAKKFFSDGSLSSRSAALKEPYCDAPDTKGVLVISQEEMTKQVDYSFSTGMELAIHAIGDYAMEIVLNAVEAAVSKGYPNKNRIRLIHDIVVNESQIERMKKLPIILDVQPILIKNWVRIAEDRIGKERMKLFFPFRTFIDNGLILTGGSDAPIELAEPLIGIQCAVTRQDLSGYPEEGLVAEQAITVYEAVSLYTKNAAYCTNEENIKGTLEPGKLADMVVLEDDIFEIPHKDIHKTKIIETVMGGETTYKA